MCKIDVSFFMCMHGPPGVERGRERERARNAGGKNGRESKKTKESRERRGEERSWGGGGRMGF